MAKTKFVFDENDPLGLEALKKRYEDNEKNNIENGESDTYYYRLWNLSDESREAIAKAIITTYSHSNNRKSGDFTYDSEGNVNGKFNGGMPGSDWIPVKSGG